MAQGDYLIQNQSFPSFRSDLNSTLEAINTSNSGTSRPTSAVAGTVWLDTTNATNPTLKFFDGTDDISLAQLDYSANTVNWLDSSVVADLVNDTTPQLGGDLDVNGNSIVSVSNGNITFTPDGTGKVIIDGLSFPTSDGTADQVLKTDGSGNLSFGDVAGGTNWQSVKTSSFTAVAGEGYPCNTTSAAFTVTLPASPTAGDTIILVDYAGTFSTNNLTLDPNGLNIQSQASNVTVSKDNEALTLTYVDSTSGWLVTSGANEGTSSITIPYSIDFLVVAGGGGGGSGGSEPDRLAGGGAGGYRTSTQSVNAGTVITVTVGDGGAVNTNGSNSSISGTGLTTITSAGGGKGSNTDANGSDGGSGGGGGGVFPSTGSSSGGAGNTPSTSPSQGNNGGGGYHVPGTDAGGGGGGGAGAVGVTAGPSPITPPNGGNGSTSSITGSSVTRAGGGGGRQANSTSGTGGSGGGGDGGNPGTSGTANTGGGGGGGGTSAGAGGKGVVILSMPTSKYTSTTTGSPTVTTSGSNTILQFNGSGSYTT